MKQGKAIRKSSYIYNRNDHRFNHLPNQESPELVITIRTTHPQIMYLAGKPPTTSQEKKPLSSTRPSGPPPVTSLPRRARNEK